jgi:hypothetical protein
MKPTFDELLKHSSAMQNNQKIESNQTKEYRPPFETLLKHANQKRQATNTDQREWNAFNDSAKNYFTNYGTVPSFDDAKNNSTQISNDYFNLARQAESLRLTLNSVEMEAEKRTEMLKQIDDVIKSARDAKGMNEKASAYYSQFESQEQIDNLNLAYELYGKYNDYENTDEALAEINDEIAVKENAYKEATEQKKKTTPGQGGGHKRRGAISSYNEEELKLLKELGLLRSQKAKLEAKKRLNERNEALKEKYVLFKGDNQFDLIADTGAKLKNPTLEEAKHYDELKNRLDVWAKDELKTLEEPVIQNPLQFFLDNRDLASKGIDESTYRGLALDQGFEWAKVMLNGFDNSWAEITEDEAKMYNYLLAKRGKESAQEFLDELSPVLNERGAESERKRKAEEWAELSGWEKAGENIASIFTNPAYNLVAGIETIETLLAGDYDPNNFTQRKLFANQQTRELTAEDLTKNIDSNLWKSVVSNTYQGIMSSLDSAVGGVFLGATGYGVTAGLGAMANKASELKKSGASNSQIALGAITSGLVEGLFEKVSLGYFFDKSDFSSIKAWIKTALIQGGIEASEEVATEIANIAAESIIQGYNSQDWQTINELVSNGMSLEKAQAQVSADNALGIFWAAYGGFISGGGMSITAGMPSYIANKIVDAKDDAQRIEALGQAVKKNNKGASAVVKYATEHGLKADIDLKTATAKDVGKVADSVYQYAKKKMDVGDLNASEELHAELIEGTKSSTVKGIINRAFQDVVIKQFNTDRETLAKAEKKALSKASGTVKTDTVDLKKPISDLVLSRKADSTVTDADVEANKDVVSRIGKALGYEVIYDDGTVLGKANGKINFANKTITLNTNVKNPVEWILKHEIGHFGQDTKAYADFVSKVRKTQAYTDWLRAKTGTNTSVDIMEAVLNRETRKLYEDAGHKLGGTTNILTGEKKGEITEANEEIISDFIADELFSGDTTNLENFLNELDKPTRNKFIQWILDLIDTIKQALTKGDKKIQAELSSLERQFTDMLKESRTEFQEADGGGTRASITAEDDGINREYAPTFYSRMEKIVSEMKQEKTGANSVIPYLTGRGVKAEEIKWSGVQDFLDGKKSVTKQELLNFIKSSALQIEEETLGESVPYTQDEKDEIERYEIERAIFIKELEFEWKQRVGTKIPIVVFAGDVDRRVTEALFNAFKEKADNTAEGKRYKSAREELIQIIKNADDFGYDNTQQAFTYASKNPNAFVSAFDLTPLEREAFDKFAKAKEAYLEKATVPEQDMRALKKIAQNIDKTLSKEDQIHSKHKKETNPKWKKYKLSGGTNYREILFKLPDSDYSNDAMATHWDSKKGVLAHARIQDFDVDGKKMLFVEELQSDWHNAGHKEGYENETNTLAQDTKNVVPDAPFKKNYHEFVLKSLLRIAAEQGYDSIGWTPADIQSKRWSDKYAEGYRIEYDKDVPKFLKTYGKQWGATVDTVVLFNGEEVWSMDITDSMREAVLYEGQERFSVTDNLKIPPFKEVSAKKAKKLTVISSGARNAYNNGEMPKSAWTKNDFIIAVHEINPKLNITELSLETLKSTFLIKTGIHETGKVNKKTQFYKINEEYVKPLTQSEVFEILAKQKNILREKGVVDFTETDSASDYADKTTELYRQFNEGKITEEELNEAIDELFQQATKKYGTIEQGESVTGDEDYSHPIPERVSKETKNRRYVRTVTEAGTLTKEMLRNEESAVLSGLRSFVPTSNKENLAKAMKRITNGQAEERWRAVVSGNASTHADDVALGELLLDGAIKSGDAVQALKLTAELSEVGTRLGQAVQALSLLKRMGGLGELYYVQKAVDSLNHNLDKQVGQKNHKQIKINEELALQLLETETEAELEYAMEAIMKDIASQVPATFLEKWNAWRYMAMLANPKTLIRNFVGNAVFAPSIMVKNSIATLGEMAFKPTERTKTFAVDKKYKDFATTDWERNQKLIMHGGKYSPSNAIQEYRTIFKNPVLEAVRKKYGEWMEQGDEKFIGGYYRRALSQYLAVNKVDIENIDETVLAKAQQSAMTEALKNTYRDASWLANALNSIARNSMFGQVVVEGIIPFKKTPINILKRSVEYSPIGLIHTMGKGLVNLKTHNYSGSQIIDSLAGGLTGTGIMLVGMLCAKALIANFGFDDEDEWWRKLNGEQEFAIKIGDYSYTVDWMAPSVIPFFIGVSLMEQLMAENNEGSIDFLKIATSSVLEPLIQLSMLQGIQESITAFGTGADDAEKWGNFATSIISNYLTQPVPTIVGKVASTMDDTSRRNYIDKNSDIPTWLQSILKKTQAKIPWFSANRTPYVNAWGEEEKTGSVWERLAENFVSPGYFSKATEDDITREITRLYKSVGDKKVLPTTPKQYFDFKNYKKHLTEQEYYEMSVSVGKKNAELVAELLQHEDYEKLSDASKVAVINDIYNWSLSCAKANLIYTFEEIQKMEIVDITEAQYNALKDSSKLAIAKEYFLNDTLWKQERKNGTVIDYLIAKEIKESGKKPKDKASVDSIVKKFS